MAAKDSDINAEQNQELEDSTNCCICMEIFKCPKLLPCGHTFCVNCIQETGLKASKGPGDEMPCPICRQQFKIPSEGFDGLQRNYFVEDLIRVTKISDQSAAALTACDACLEDNPEESANRSKKVPRADMYCTDCKQKLCEECCRHHRKLKLTKNHKLLSITGQTPTDEDLIQSLATSVCELHRQEDLKLYCYACKTVACSICFFENHVLKGHKGIHVNKAVDDFRKEIASNIEKVKTYISQAEMKKSEVTEAKQDLHKKSESLQSDINRRKDIIKQMAEKHANSLLEELILIKQSIMKEIHMETDDIDAQLMRLESYNSSCKKIMTKGSACDICLSVGDLSARVNELQAEIQSLTDRQLKPLSLFFIETECEEKNEHNMIGQLKEQDHSSQTTNRPTINTRKSVFTFLNQKHDSLLLSISNSLTINVKHGEMTKMSSTDVVVSCINNQLDVDGALAQQIMRAAGPKVTKELLSLKRRLSSLPTGCVIHTSAGVLRGAKAIIHVVRPQDHRSTEALIKVFANCLSYTNDVLRLKSICLPPVAYSFYAAQLVVDSFLDAVEMFASTVANGNPSAAAQHQPNPHHLSYIQLVTNDQPSIRQLIRCIGQHAF